MERKTLVRLILTAVVAGALALAGCGGDSGGGVDQSVHDMVAAERDAAAMAQADAEAEAEAAAAAQAEAETQAEAAMAAQLMAEAQAATAMAAQADAEAAAEAAEAAETAAEAAQAAAEAALENATIDEAVVNAIVEAELKALDLMEEADVAEADGDDTLAAALRAAAKVAMDAAQATRDSVVADAAVVEAVVSAKLASDMAERAAQEARVAAAKERNKADKIKDEILERKRIDAASIQNAGNATPVAMYQGPQGRPGNMMLTAENDGTEITFKATQGAGMETLFEFSVDAAEGGGSHSEEDLPGGHDKHIYLMSDIEPAGTIPFPVDPDGLAPRTFDQMTQMWQYPVEDTDTEETGFQNDDVMIYPGSLAPTDQAPETVVQEDASFDGKFAGTPGTYICTAEMGCGFTRDSDDELVVQATDNTTWAFVPSSTAPAPDADYLVFGAWLKKPGAATGIGYSAAIASGSSLFDIVPTDNPETDASGLLPLTGEATYTGSTVGFFAERHVNESEAVSGTFEASAELNADFDTVSTWGSISGKITDFNRSDDVAVNWQVDLDMINLDDPTGQLQLEQQGQAAPNNMPGGFVTGTTSGHAAGADWDGNWGVEFTAGGTTAGMNPLMHPGGVVGTFGAAHGMPEQLEVLDPTSSVPDEGYVGVIGGFGARVE